MARRKPAPDAREIATQLADVVAAVPPDKDNSPPTPPWPRAIELDLGEGVRAITGCAALADGHRWWVTVEARGVKSSDAGVVVPGGQGAVEAAQASAIAICRRRVEAALAVE